MAKRKIIKIDQDKCNGCGLCIPNCPEGAIQIIDNKARLISDLFCDGLGACLGHCPQGAITIEEREAEAYDERKVMANIVKQGPNVIKAHLRHLKEHNEVKLLKEAQDYLEEKGVKVSLEEAKPQFHQGCPGSKMMEFRKKQDKPAGKAVSGSAGPQESELGNWPVQLMLIPAFAPYLNDSDLLISADCVPFAYADFHKELLKGKVLIIGCPKLDDNSAYAGKLKQIFENNKINSVTYAHMEVPCCFGLLGVIESAIKDSGKQIPFNEVVIGIRGERLK